MSKQDEKNSASVLCPTCQQEQSDNGLIAWCDNGHIYDIAKTDSRWSAR